MSESIWSKTVDIPGRPVLSGSLSVEAAVIGGGLAGILTARLLQAAGVQVVVLEADRIGSGQTKNTTAKITAQHGLIYQKLSGMGSELSARYAAANRKAIADYARIIAEEHIDCGFTRAPAYLYSTASPEPLRLEADAAQRAGIDAVFTTDTALPFPVKGAVKFHDQAQFHPLAFLRAVSQPLDIYEHTRVTKVEGETLFTDRGTVTAKHIVFATHFPFLNFPGYYFLRMHQARSYVVALEHAAQLDDMYLGVDDDGLSLRTSGPYLLLGGGGHRTGEHSAGGSYQLLRDKAAKYWPGSREAAHWSAQDCMTLDGIPYIGRFSGNRPNWYVATGFGKWGMTSSMVSATLLTALITGAEAQEAAVFSPQRFASPASAKTLLQNSLQAVKGLSRELISLPPDYAESLGCGRGGVVDYKGRKLGVYKDESGQLFAIDPRCPHLGCQLEWNPDERSWDCPCHGSRFDYRGNLLDGPAQEDLTRST
ncbi:MAG: FAD-dependent oxidoreductase [Clostridiales bacterium]|nr:FAD-dependent oxidoreductase [Clostridiales bacterium]